MTDAVQLARSVAATGGIRTVVLVEGVSDQVAIETLAGRRGRDLAGEGVAIVPMGGAMSIARFLDEFGPAGLDLQLAGLCDVGEERFFRHAVEHAGLADAVDRERMEALGFFVCVADLEDELIRSLGAGRVEEVITEQGDLAALRTFQQQPAQRGRTREQQFRRFMGVRSGRKAHYSQSLVEGLDLRSAPRPLDLLLARL
ncbi:TOPRIM nucleotidyl transferase/hydrolase domain-containing protein [Diaminobutyricibacter sp. McL0618]|uniref:TOPRIM nucleotidyl transferase/hydrolase domain-containing protein n=1 Tax=Leifsonia sp. McL0618 TaxID=3415677 RepID=UPI003CED7A87